MSRAFRVVREQGALTIRGVWSNDENNVTAYSKFYEYPYGYTLDALREQVEAMREALEQPVLVPAEGNTLVEEAA